MGKLLEQGLTWKYISSSGKLIVKIKTFVDLGTGESCSENSIALNSLDECKVILELGGSGNSPVIQEFETYYSIESGRNIDQMSDIRADIERLKPIKVTTTLIDNNNSIVGEVTNLTSSNSEIEIN